MIQQTTYALTAFDTPDRSRLKLPALMVKTSEYIILQARQKHAMTGKYQSQSVDDCQEE